MARELNEQVQRVEEWGLPIPRDEHGQPLKRGRASIKIFGERIKPILGKRAEASRRDASSTASTSPALATHDGRVIGAFGFSTRDGRFYAMRAKAVLVCTGGAAGLYRPSNPGMASHRMWYSPFNTGAGLAMGIRAGAEMTSLRVPLHPAAHQGRDRADRRDRAVARRQADQRAAASRTSTSTTQHLGGQRMTTQDRLYATLQEKRAGRGPCYLDLRGVNARKLEGTIARVPVDGAAGGDDHAATRCTTRAQGGEMAPVEITGGEPHVVGGHGLSGFWIDDAAPHHAARACGPRATSPAARRRSTRRAPGPRPCSRCAT